MGSSRDHKKRRKRRRRKLLRRLSMALGITAASLVLVVLGAEVFLYAGQSSLHKKEGQRGPQLGLEETAEGLTGETGQEGGKEPGHVWEEGWVRYEGEVYAYNEDILTFLVMGIDSKGEAEERQGLTNGGQSDALFLLIINPHKEDISILAIDRNTMTDIRMAGIGDGGADIVAKAQLAVQHGFGDGKEKSCELTRDTVSQLLYGLPIHGYISVNYEAIPYINDAVGGVEVTVPEDLAGAKSGWKAGEKVLLQGRDAITYVKWRDTTVFESARMRTKRQKEYLTAFIRKAIEATKQDVTMPVKLYNRVKGYTVTDISLGEMAYLASELAGYRFSGDQIYTMEGETVMGERYEEFYPDMEALREQMIGLFYERVETGEYE